MTDKDQTEDKALEFDVMPGADAAEDDNSPQLDLSFPDLDKAEADTSVEETEQEAEEAEEVEEVEEEVEEIVSDDEQSTEEETELEAEAEAEAEAEPEAALEEPEVEEKPASKKMVPKARLDEVLNKQKALQKQIDDMKAAQAPAAEAPEEFDFGAKELEYQNLLLDGEAEKAAQLRADIRQAERVQIEYEMTQKMSDTVSNNHQATALQQAATTLEAEFPMFDQRSSQYDEAMTQEVIELRDAFIIKGENPVAALSKAAKFVISENGLVDIAPALSSTTAPATNQDEVAKKRAQVSKKLSAASAQPPEMQGEGTATRTDKALDVSNMTEDEFAALPEATLKRLRGDIM